MYPVDVNVKRKAMLAAWEAFCEASKRAASKPSLDNKLAVASTLASYNSQHAAYHAAKTKSRGVA
jgi:hypothetical protein